VSDRTVEGEFVFGRHTATELSVAYAILVPQRRARVSRAGHRRSADHGRCAVAFVLVSVQPTTTAPAEQKDSGVATSRDVLLVTATKCPEDEVDRPLLRQQDGARIRLLRPRVRRPRPPLRGGLGTAVCPGQPVGVMQRLGAAPFGPGSQAAWRADGSPTAWTMPGTGKTPDPWTVAAAAGPSTMGP
jgi:hypothetical protein